MKDHTYEAVAARDKALLTPWVELGLGLGSGLGVGSGRQYDVP